MPVLCMPVRVEWITEEYCLAMLQPHTELDTGYEDSYDYGEEPVRPLTLAGSHLAHGLALA